MSKTIKVQVSNDGGMTVEFGGFEGRTCFEESAQLKKILEKNYGLDVEEIKISESREEVEVRHLDNAQHVGR